jgi:hypothetical protein
LLNVDDDHAIAVVVARRRKHLVTAAEHVLPHDLCRHVRIAGLREIAVRGSANEAAFTLRVKPSRGFSIRDYRSHGRARCLLAPAAASSAWGVLRALPSPSALVAAPSSVVTVVALARLTLLLIAVARLLAAARAAHRLRIVR